MVTSNSKTELDCCLVDFLNSSMAALHFPSKFVSTGMVASGVTAKGLNGIEAGANKLAKAPKGD